MSGRILPVTVVDPLSHPLFASGLGATRGGFAHAFKGLAAILDEEEAEAAARTDSQSPVESQRCNSAPTTSTEDGEEVSSSAAPATLTWTRPSAIRIARLKAEAAEREQRGEVVQTRAQRRTTPYGRSKARGTASARSSPAPTSPDQDAHVDTASDGGGYGAIRSHATRRSRNPSYGVPARMSVRSSAELAAEAESAGETTLLLKMWNI